MADVTKINGYDIKDATARNNIETLNGESVKITAQTFTDAQKSQARQNINTTAPDGYYGESGGVFEYSTNFIGKNAVTESNDIVYRPTASEFSGQDWVQSSIDGQAATIEKIKGKTLVWNQLVQNGNFANTSGWGATRGTISVSNNVLTFTIDEVGTYKNHNRVQRTGINLPLNHKFLCCGEFLTTNGEPVIVSPASDAYAGSYINTVAGVWIKYAQIITKTVEHIGVGVAVDCRNSSVGDTWSVRNVMIIDITKMYGAGNEPATVEEFKAMFPLDYYAYNPGELISLNATGLKTNGFNQWDEEWEEGSINLNTGGKTSSSTKIRSKNFIRVFSNTNYYAEGSTRLRVCFYDSNYNFINGVELTHSFTTPSNCAYIMFCTSDSYGTTYKNDVTINLAWSGIRNGEYEPYWDSTLSLPISTYFPDGMKSAGAVYDELTKDKAIKRIGKVDLGTLTYTTNTTYGYRLFVVSRLSDMLGNSSNFICSKFAYKTGSVSGFDNNNMAIGTNYINIRCDDYSTAAEFKTAMSGVYLYYELEEPVETPISPELNLTYRCDDFGTEMLLPENDDEPITAPMDADIIYQIDYEAQIRNNDSLNITKKSMDNFIAAFNASGLGIITETWNPTTGEYQYTVSQPVQAEQEV